MLILCNQSVAMFWDVCETIAVCL